MASSPTRTPPSDPPEVPFGANAVRLSPAEWVVAALIVGALFALVPSFWERIEPLDAGPDYRVPFRLGSDYWTAGRYFHEACSKGKTLILGDSVVWGHYVAKEETLSHYLNELVGEDRFANLGIDGIEPVAMAGLVEFYGSDVASKNVILHCNLLWTADKRRDLQTTKERPFTHPRLLPQFSVRIPCYKASLEERIARVVDRSVPFLGWTNHLQVAYLKNMDIPTWTAEHPYKSPTAAITLELPSPDELREPVAVPWTENPNSKILNAPWVELEGSFQWRFFRQTVDVLRRRGNRVFVFVGPFNESMLTGTSRAVYQKRKREVAAWLEENEIPYAIPEALPSEEYADASHPLGEGYRRLAERLLDDESLRRFLQIADAGDDAPASTAAPARR
ncbi:MAG: hypothetical protein ACYTG0_45530 [Planctomycetota bacterium]|jgi:hypothetical protein